MGKGVLCLNGALTHTDTHGQRTHIQDILNYFIFILYFLVDKYANKNILRIQSVHDMLYIIISNCVHVCVDICLCKKGALVSKLKCKVLISRW